MRIDLFEAFGLDPNIITILKGKYGEMLLHIQQDTSLFLKFSNTTHHRNISNLENIIIQPMSYDMVPWGSHFPKEEGMEQKGRRVPE